MLRLALRFSFCFLAWMYLAGILPGAMRASEVSDVEKTKTGFYKDVFDQNIYEEGLNFLRFDRLWRRLSRKPLRSLGVNAFDEVPDNDFFTNRHGRKAMSSDELERGFRENDGPDLGGNLSVISGQFLGIYPEFLVVRDGKGEEYTVEFDPPENLELVSASEVVASRFLYAIGYNVPQYSVVSIPPEKMVAADDAVIVDNSGFQRRLTQEKLENSLLFLGKDENGNFRASARKTISGTYVGGFSLRGRRKADTNDQINHERRREIRALQVFASWIALDRVCESNTMDVIRTEEGKRVFKHYLLDFNSAFGSGRDGVKLPMETHEYLFDYGDMVKGILTLGWWERPWQKRWRETDQFQAGSSLGYYDNRYFDPKRFKTELPYHAFKDVTRADGFWAAKIMMAFSDSDIGAMVKAGRLTNPDDMTDLTNIAAKRRDVIARHWFSESSPLDRFTLETDVLRFSDLAVQHGFIAKEERAYRIEVLGFEGEKEAVRESIEISEPAVALSKWWAGQQELRIRITASAKNNSKQVASVLVRLGPRGLEEIVHVD